MKKYPANTGAIRSHCKDSYEPISTMKSHVRVLLPVLRCLFPDYLQIPLPSTEAVWFLVIYRSHKRWKQRCSLQLRIILSKTPSSSWSKIQILDMFLEWSHSEALYTKQDLLILDRWRYLNLWKGKQSQKGHRQNCQVQLFCPKWWHDSNKRPQILLEIQIPYIVASQPITLTYLPPEIAGLLQCVLTIGFPSFLHKAFEKSLAFRFGELRVWGVGFGWPKMIPWKKFHQVIASAGRHEVLEHALWSLAALPGATKKTPSKSEAAKPKPP